MLEDLKRKIEDAAATHDGVSLIVDGRRSRLLTADTLPLDLCGWAQHRKRCHLMTGEMPGTKRSKRKNLQSLATQTRPPGHCPPSEPHAATQQHQASGC